MTPSVIRSGRVAPPTEVGASTASAPPPAPNPSPKPKRFWRYWAVTMLVIALAGLGAAYAAAQWLAAQAPRVTAGPLGGFMLDDRPGESNLPALERIDTTGQGDVLPEPPQPLADGRRGVPQRPSISTTAPIPVVQATASGALDPNNPTPTELPQDQPFIDFDTLTLPERLAIQQAEAVDLPRTETLPSQGSAPIVVVEAVQAPTSPPAPSPLPSAGATSTPPAASAPVIGSPPAPTPSAPAVEAPAVAATASPPNPDAWVSSLRQDLQTCSSLGFFARTACENRARQRWCEPNNGFNRVRECGFRSNETGGGN